MMQINSAIICPFLSLTTMQERGIFGNFVATWGWGQAYVPADQRLKQIVDN